MARLIVIIIVALIISTSIYLNTLSRITYSGCRRPNCCTDCAKKDNCCCWHNKDVCNCVTVTGMVVTRGYDY